MLTGVIIVILMNMLLLFFGVLTSKTIVNYILFLNTFGSIVILLIVVLAFVINKMELLDVALVYALINFVSTIAFLRFFKYKTFSK